MAIRELLSSMISLMSDDTPDNSKAISLLVSSQRDDERSIRKSRRPTIKLCSRSFCIHTLSKLQTCVDGTFLDA